MPVVTRYLRVNGFPTGLATVGYTLFSGPTVSAARTTVGVTEFLAGSGEYGASVTVDDAVVDAIGWDAGTSPNRYAVEGLTPLPAVVGGVSTPVVLGLNSAAAVADLNRRLGTYAALADAPAALAWAMRSVGPAPASPYTVADSELAAVPADRMNELIGIAEWRGLETILLNLDDEGLRQIGATDLPAEKVRPLVERRVGRLFQYLESTYGFGRQAPTAGSIAGRFASPANYYGY